MKTASQCSIDYHAVFKFQHCMQTIANHRCYPYILPYSPKGPLLVAVVWDLRLEHYY